MTDWEGKPVPENESPDKTVLVWEVDPYPSFQSSNYDVLVVRSWQQMVDFVSNNLGTWLGDYTEEELREGVSLKFKLEEMQLVDIPTEDDP